MAASFALATVPQVCGSEQAWSDQRAPAALTEYLATLGGETFDLRAVCTRWAATFSRRHRALADRAPSFDPQPARFILFPSAATDVDGLARWLSRSSGVREVEVAQRFVVAKFGRRVSASRLRELIDAPQVGYAEPDCDGPDFLTTSVASAPESAPRCWLRSARATFPNDPCMEDLWGHKLIGWDSKVAARSLPRLVAVLDSGIDATHEDLARNIVLSVGMHEPPRSEGMQLNRLCATSGRCNPHGTEMAGTIGGRMDNGIGVAGVAPNSQLLPIVISKLDSRLLGRLSTIAEGIDAAVLDDVDIINISAKWPVDSRAISDSVHAAVAEGDGRRRLLVTGYATSLDLDDSVREYFPSQYRCLPGVVAAVPTDMRGHELFNPDVRPNATDGRIQAPGVDIVVTTTENSERGYALSESAGASSAAAYVSGAVALVWGSPPLNKCDAQEVKQLLFCRSKRSKTTRYPWVHVNFLRELSDIDPGADCRTAMEALGCG